MSFPRRLLGSAGLSVSAIGVGCMGMTGLYGTVNRTEAIATIRAALDAGIDMIDTAEAYGPFANELLVGEALAGRRHRAVVATKVGYRLASGRMDGLDSRPESIRAAVEGSLGRLGVERIDLLYQHRVDPAVPIEDVVGAMGDLVHAGKVAHIGLSKAGADTIRRAHAVHPLAAVQSEYSLRERGLEREVLPLLQSLGIGLVAYGPLGRSFLTDEGRSAGELDQTDFRRSDPRLSAAGFEDRRASLDPLRAVAAAHGATMAQVALAWLLTRMPGLVPIPGTSSRHHLGLSMQAADIDLSDLEVLRLSDLPGLEPAHEGR